MVLRCEGGGGGVTDYAIPLEAIRVAIAVALRAPDRISVAGTPLRTVEWAGRRTASRSTRLSGATVDLRVQSLASVGRDEIRYDAGTPVVTGNRSARITLKVSSESQEPGRQSSSIADAIRTRISAPAPRAAMVSGGVGYSHSGPAVSMDRVDADGRVVSETVMEMGFNLAVYDREDAPGYDGWISTVDITGTLGADPGGRSVPVFVEDGTLPLLRTATGGYVLTLAGEYIYLPGISPSPTGLLDESGSLLTDDLLGHILEG